MLRLPKVIGLILPILSIFFFVIISPVQAAPTSPPQRVYSSLIITGTKTATPTDTVNAGELITYTLTFTPDSDKSLLIIDPVPEFTEYQAGTITSSSANVVAVDRLTHTMSWVGTGLRPDVPVEVGFTVRVKTPISHHVIITNVARIDTITVTTRHVVSSTPVLTLTQHGPTQATVFNPMLYTLDYGNLGTMTATQVVITDILPKGMVYIASNPPALEERNRISWFIDTLPPQITNSIQITVTTSVSGVFTNRVIMTSREHPPVQSESRPVVVSLESQATATPFVPTTTPTMTATQTPTPTTPTPTPPTPTATLPSMLKTYLPLIIKPAPQPKIELNVMVSPVSAGLDEQVNYSYRVVNRGNVALTDLTLTDSFKVFDLAMTRLEPNNQIEATNSYQIGQTDLLQLLNNVQVTAKFEHKLLVEQKTITVTIPTAQLWIQSRNAGNLDLTLTRKGEEWLYNCNILNNSKMFCQNLHPGEYRLQTNTRCGLFDTSVKFAVRDETRPYVITCN